MVTPIPSAEYLTPSESAADEPDPNSSTYGDTRTLPHFVRPVGDNISPQDLVFLWHKGALSTPDLHLRNALVQCFVEFVHPIVPVVDLKEFLLAVGSPLNIDAPKTSILLFQAVMFSAAAFVDINILRKSGFASRIEARKLFYERAKVSFGSQIPH